MSRRSFGGSGKMKSEFVERRESRHFRGPGLAGHPVSREELGTLLP